MKRTIVFFRKQTGNIFRGSLFVLCIAAIVHVLPKEGKFPYEFQKGQRWMHKMLVAENDFPIYKSEKELKQEKDSIRKNYIPYFNYNTSSHPQQLDIFSNVFEEKWTNYIKPYYKNKPVKEIRLSRAHTKFRNELLDFSTQLIEFIFNKGVLDLSTVENINRENVSIIIIKDNLHEIFDINEVFTLGTAKQYINKKVESLRLNLSENETKKIEFLNALTISSLITPNLFFDKEGSEKRINQQIDELILTKGMVYEGERVVRTGEVINTRIHQLLESYKKEDESRRKSSANHTLILVGQIVLTFAAIFVLFLFLLHFRTEILQDTLKTAFILILVASFVALPGLIARFYPDNMTVSLYIIPFAILPIIINTFYDSRLALFIHLITILILGFIVPESFSFVFIQIITGIIAIFSLTNVRRRGQLFFSASMIFLTYSIIYLGILILQESTLSGINWKVFVWLAINALLLLTTYPLIYIFEKLFGFLSDVTLMELSDTNHPLLRELAEKAPGTFQHSLQVANLAEEIVYKIGGNPMLARTGALYHDIGKMNIAHYFIENQSHGHNPHDKLPYDESAEIIVSHVKKGEELGKKNNLPRQVIDFISMHHGTTKALYFFRAFKEEHPDVDVDERKFTYAGPTPTTKETVAVMMADSVEAASRSMKIMTLKTINDIVENIINYQIKEEQFNNSDVTFKDISTIKELLKKKLESIYHARIAYPQKPS